MNKADAQAEILRRLGKHLDMIIPVQYLIDYKNGKVSKEELLNMITQDENGNVLSEPDLSNYVIKKEERYNYEAYDKDSEQYQQAREEAIKLIEEYESTTPNT